MPDSGWRTAALAVNDASRGGVFAWQNAAGAAGGTGAAKAHNPAEAVVGPTQLLVAYAPAGIVPQGAKVTGIQFEIRLPLFGGAQGVQSFLDLFLATGGTLGEHDFILEGAQQGILGFDAFVRWGSDTTLFDGTWTADDFTGDASGFGFALRIAVKPISTVYISRCQFRFHWEVVEQEAILGEGRGSGLPPTLIAGSNLTPAPGEGSGAGLTPLLISSFGRWLSPEIDLDPLRLAQAAAIEWDETVPGGTAVTVQARVTDAAGVAGPWAQVDSGDTIAALLAAGDLDGQSLAVQVTLTTTALPATPRVANLRIEASGAYGLSQGFYRNPLTANLSPLSQGVAADDGDATFDAYVPTPVAESIYDAPEVDIGFDDRARLWAEVDSVTGPGEGGLVDVTTFVAHRTEAEEMPPMHALTTEEAELRYARFRLVLDNTQVGALVRDFVPTVDQQERTINATITVAPGGTALVFDPPFHQLPGVELTAEAEGGAARYGAWENRSTAGVTLHVFDAAGDSVGGTVTYTITGV